MTIYDLKEGVVELEEVKEVCVLTLKNIGAGAAAALMRILISAGYIVEMEQIKKDIGSYTPAYKLTIKERQL